MKRSLILMLFFAVLATACKKKKDPEPDKQNPSIELLKLQGETTVEGKVVAGTEAEIDYRFRGEGLKEAKFDIHSNFDGHSHRKASGYVDFEWEEIKLLGGVSLAEGHFHIDVPLDATPGMYDLSVRVTDNNGNQSILKVYEFEIVSNEDAPLIDVTSHDHEDEIEIDIDVCAPFTFEFTATAQAGATLAKVEVIVKEEGDDHGHSHRVADGDAHVIYEWEKDDFTDETSYDFSESIDLCADLEVGHYELLIIVVDSEGRVTQESMEIHVTGAL